MPVSRCGRTCPQWIVCGHAPGDGAVYETTLIVERFAASTADGKPIDVSIRTAARCRTSKGTTRHHRPIRDRNLRLGNDPLE